MYVQILIGMRLHEVTMYVNVYSCANAEKRSVVSDFSSKSDKKRNLIMTALEVKDGMCLVSSMYMNKQGPQKHTTGLTEFKYASDLTWDSRTGMPDERQQSHSGLCLFVYILVTKYMYIHMCV